MHIMPQKNTGIWGVKNTIALQLLFDKFFIQWHKKYNDDEYNVVMTDGSSHHVSNCNFQHIFNNTITVL